MGSMVGYFSIPGAVAGGDLSSGQYRAVVGGGTGREVDIVTDANAQRPLGILQDDPDTALQRCDVAVFGVCKAELGGTVTRYDTLASNDSGQLITDAEVADGSAVDLHHIAVALESGVSGDIIDVLLHSAVRIGLE